MTQEYRLLEVDWLKHMWRPDSFFKNAKSVTFQTMTIPNHYMWLYKDKTILYMVKLTLRLSCAMNFAIYPHDTQECKLQMESCILKNIRLIRPVVVFNFLLFFHQCPIQRMTWSFNGTRTFRWSLTNTLNYPNWLWCEIIRPIVHRFIQPVISPVSRLCSCWNVDLATTFFTRTFRLVWLSSCR